MKNKLRAHSYLGASSAKRWLNCPGSINLIKKCPEPKSTPFAKEGTVAHGIAEKFLKKEMQFLNEVLDKEIDGIKVSMEMLNHISSYVLYVLKIRKEVEGELLIEHRFHLPNLHPDFYGTCDALIMQHFGDLHVIDFKYGQGINVEVENNEQGMYYALAALQLGDFENVYIHIYQPRVENPVKVWKTSPAELVEYGKRLKVGAALTEQKNAPLKTGEWCGFCPALGACPLKLKEAKEITKSQFDELPLELPIPHLMTKLQIAKVVEYSLPLRKWIEAVEEHALNLMLDGEKIEGLKIVKGRNKREWIDETKTEELLRQLIGEKTFSRKLISVAQAEKMVDSSSLSGLYQTIEGGPTVTSSGDKRKSFTQSKDAFEQIDESDF